jgi:hypothetical protein
MSAKPQTVTYLDTKGIEKYTNYTSNNVNSTLTTKSLNTSSIFNTLNRSNISSNLNLSDLNNLTDSKNFNNSLKYELSYKGNKTYIPSAVNIESTQNNYEFEIFNKSLDTSINYLNNPVTYTFEDLKSGNQSLLPGERTVRGTDKLNPQKNLNTEFKSTNINSLSTLYKSKITNNSSMEDLNRFLSVYTTYPLNHNPVMSMGSSVKDLGFDRTFVEGVNPTLLQSKEESAPNIIFETY